jgi:hypothetical protein
MLNFFICLFLYFLGLFFLVGSIEAIEAIGTIEAIEAMTPPV